jgi:acyl-[acyl-carrier-protein]-phospholipid O-acyltransferase/long-chain-fatty-acid--[acyl-carrier-protein] ligase
MSAVDSGSSAELPPYSRDRAFLGMTVTQFLGAFNDNLFKQLVLLICVDYQARTGTDYQGIATALFAIPFVLLSGYAGFLADRTGKRRIVVLCKVGEIAVMLMGMLAFLGGAGNPERQLFYLFVVLGLMSTQSAFFGPSKYGILPELFRDRDLPMVNGVIQMTTFTAIIFGMALAGYCKEWLGDRLWIVSGICVSIAVAGTLTSLLVRKTPVAHPGLPFRVSSLTINSETWQMLRADRKLMGVLCISSLFWFLGGVCQQAINAFGDFRLHYSDGRTSMLVACMGVGIAVGCLFAGKASHKRVAFHLVTWGAWGLVLSFLALIGVGLFGEALPRQVADAAPQGLLELLTPRSATDWAARGVLTMLGIFAGMFVVPLQVFMQSRPPDDQKGRMIGGMNLINWIGIVCSAAFYAAATATIKSIGRPPAEIYWIFAALAAVILPVAVFYRPQAEAPNTGA